MLTGGSDRFLGLLDREWTVVGALATAVAAAVALLLPIAFELRLRWRDGRRERRRRQNVVDASHHGISIVGAGLCAWCSGDAWKLERQLAWSVAVGRRLDLYAQDALLSDDLIDCCVSVSSALEIFRSLGVGDTLQVLSRRRARDAHAATTIAIHAGSVLERIRSERDLDPRFRGGAKRDLLAAIDAMNMVPLDPSIETDC